ncbi:MAG: hypothetical protein RIF41_18440 [Polyangiaceae bacterium]
MVIRGAGRRAAIAAAAIAVGAIATHAFADDHPIALSWRAPTGCPTETSVRRRIDDLIAGASVGRALAADVVVERDAGGFHVQMRLADERGGGERSLDAGTCEEIAEATALIVALAYDPEAVAANQARQAEGGGGEGEGGRSADPPPTPNILPLPPVVPVAPPPPAPAVVAPPPVVPPPPSREPHSRVASTRFVAAPLVGVELGALPSAAALVGGELAVRLDPFDVRLRGLFALPVRDTVQGRDAGGDFDRWTVGPAVCLAPWRTRRASEGRIGGLRLAPCVGFELGQMRGRGFGVQNPDEGAALWLAPTPEGHLSLTLLPWLELELTLAAAIPLRRPDFVLNQVGIVHQAAPLTGRTTAALTLVLP